MAIPEEFLNELRERVDIEELISGYVDLKRQGRLSKGLCPFHSEKTPSFAVYPDTHSYYCFGCAKGGDIITFVRDIENLDYIEAVKFLAERAGLNMPEDNNYDDTIAKKKRRMLEMNKEAARFYHNYMLSPEGKAGLDYWLGRGLTMNTIRHFGLGYAPDDWRRLIFYMRSLGYSEAELFEVDLAKRSTKDNKVNYYDNFRNRAMVPIIDLRGNIIAFGGRVLDDSKPKYVNTSDTLIYKKSLAVFALNFAKSAGTKQLILCEGYMDVIALHQAGFKNAVAGLGTALTNEQVRLISRYCDEVVLAYDGDVAGQEALQKAIAKFEQTDLSIKALTLTGGKDPDEIIKKFGAERFRSIIDGASNEIEYKLLAAKEGIDTESDDGRVKYLRKAVPILADIKNAIERDVYAARLSTELGVSKDAVQREVKDAERRQNRRNNRIDFGQLRNEFDSYRDKTAHDVTAGIKARKAEEAILTSLQNNPDFFKRIDDLTEDDFTDDFNRRLFKALKTRVDEGKPIDLIYLSSEFPPDEMGRIVKLQTGGSLVSNTFSEVQDCIKVLKTEKTNSVQVNPATMSDDEFRKLFQKDT